MAAPLVVFRADAAPQMGGGHVQRCLALGETLAAAGWQSAFAFRPPTLETVPALACSPHRLLPIEDGDEEGSSLIPAVLGSRCDLLVVDHYRLGSDFEMGGRAYASRIMAIEDFPGRNHDCDLLLDPTPGRRHADYDGLVPAGCELLLGPDYALLRRQFPEQRQAVISRRARGSEPTRIFVSLGMTDPSNLTAAVLQGVAESETGLAIDVVIGSAAPHVAVLRRQIASLRLDAHLHLDADNVAELMAAADFAIGAAGSSSFERCCLGLPSLIVVAADNQRDIAAALINSGAAEVVGPNDLTREVATGVKRLCADPNARIVMAEAAAKLCDGRGAERVASELLALA